MKDIKELALKVGNELSKEDKFHWDGSLFVFIEKFFAAYTEGQEPVAWLTKDGVRCNPLNTFSGPTTVAWEVPLYAAPPLTEPAPQQQKPQTTTGSSADPAQPAVACAAPTPEEVREIISDLLAVIETINQGHHAADHYDAITISCAADMIERLAAVNTNLNSENALLLKWKLEGVPEGCVVVPREPTDKWVEQVIRFYQPHLDRNCLAWRKCEEHVRHWHKAMIAAGEVQLNQGETK